MDSSKLTRAGDRTDWSVMAPPVTWDNNTPLPGAPPGDGTEKTPSFEMADLGEGFGEGEGEHTVVVSSAYELRPRFTGRTRAIAQLQDLSDKAFGNRQLGFALVLGDPGMGKSRMISELVARIRTKHP